ncbi:hypothetical protein [Ruegeria lacuscaerulensis]|uniref:hypothetical protein n=1 Tax=Ruegeria lacuscaerulensis TaxID=55218 RepID=UPI00147D077D|nr:hypothetical protein [Ruegeria lacuscaerulensis]
MTHIASSLNPDRINGKAATHSKPFRSDRAQTSHCASESGPLSSSCGGRSQEFRTPFEDVNDDVIWQDYRDATKALLTALTRVLIAFVLAGVGTLIWANLPF